MTQKTNYKEYLDNIQKLVHAYLRPLGFKKKGRTHNKILDKGLIQVINFQMGEFPVGDNYVIPGIRESFYGKFTINLGVYIKEIKDLDNFVTGDFIGVHNCTIRTRLTHLTAREDIWWLLTDECEKTANEIIDSLKNEVQKWFDLFNDRKKIVIALSDAKKSRQFMTRGKLDAALIQIHIDRKEGERLFNEYYHSLDEKIPHEKFHKEYVTELAAKLKIIV